MQHGRRMWPEVTTSKRTPENRQHEQQQQELNRYPSEVGQSAEAEEIQSHLPVPPPQAQPLNKAEELPMKVDKAEELPARVGKQQSQQPMLVDIGTGSGAIAVTIACLCKDWQVTATDISPAALSVAQTNAERNGVGERIHWLEGDLLRPVIEAGITPNILVSNPPYIPSHDITELQPEVRIHEPHLALDGGPDGLEPYRRIVRQMAELPAYPELVGFEVGIHQAEAVTALLSDLHQWDWIKTVPDLAGIARHVIAGREA
ncbi:MAG: peptide chain release factor N(5)-glutamine methyltransferase [Gorillibacterium sp.]|nr:peptide chain release factor N(5)-glutamine methyltransferase [Gorillibacterium sp.]